MTLNALADRFYPADYVYVLPGHIMANGPFQDASSEDEIITYACDSSSTSMDIVNSESSVLVLRYAPIAVSMIYIT